MGFKKITVIVFNEHDETELKMVSTLDKTDNRKFTRDVAKIYLKVLKLENYKNNIFIRIAKNGHLFLNGVK